MDRNDNVVINLDKPYTLRMTNGVLKRFCASHKLGMGELEKAIDRYDMMLDMVYFMILREAPNMTQAEFDRLIDEVPIVEVVNSCAAAFTAAFGVGEESEERDPT